MAIERARGISVVTSVMTFEYGGAVFNLLDTLGHEDFSVYRTLTAVDAAVMVIDAAKGIEARTRKLFEICRLRDIPIVTFINKMDRESREPIELLDEIEKVLALDTAPVVWPIGRGRDFAHLRPDEPAAQANGPRRRRRPARRPRRRAARRVARARGLRALARGGRPRRRGVRPLRPGVVPPRPPDAGVLRQRAQELRRPRPARRAHPPRAPAGEPEGDDAHRRGDRAGDDRGRSRSRRTWTPTTATASPSCACARGGSRAACASSSCAPARRWRCRRRSSSSRRSADRRGGLRRRRRRHPQPRHAAHRRHADRGRGPDVRRHPELRARDPAARARARRHPRAQARTALEEMAEEGVVQLFSPLDGSSPVVGVIGALQLDVLADRLANEYGLPAEFETTAYDQVRWIASDDTAALEAFVAKHRSAIASDLDGDPVFLAPSAFMLQWTAGMRLSCAYRREEHGPRLMSGRSGYSGLVAAQEPDRARLRAHRPLRSSRASRAPPCRAPGRRSCRPPRRCAK